MRRAAALLALAGGVLALDQWTKHLASALLAGRPPVRLLDDIVQLTYALNSGVAFSLGAGTRFPFFIFSIAAAVAILWLLARGSVRRLAQQIALALVLGGALGNLVDRITTGLVVDFIEIGFGRFRWPVFNVADSAVTVGVVLFILAGSSSSSTAVDAPQGSAADAPTEDPPVAPLSLNQASDDGQHPGAIGGAGAGGPASGPIPGDHSGRPLA
jgi:signal peptidase II